MLYYSWRLYILDRLYGEDYFNPDETSRFATNKLSPETLEVLKSAKTLLEINAIDSKIEHIKEMMDSLSLQGELKKSEEKKQNYLDQLINHKIMKLTKLL